MNNGQHFLKQLGLSIQSTRKSKGVMKKEIAINLRMTEQAYGRIENGRVNVPINRLIQIAEYLNVGIEKFIYDK